jgi:hypothetical protein
VALIAVLEMSAAEAQAAGGKQLLCVANTHIHANPELNDVKLWQVHTLLKGLEKIANRCVGGCLCVCVCVCLCVRFSVSCGGPRLGATPGCTNPTVSHCSPTRAAHPAAGATVLPLVSCPLPTCKRSADIPMLVAGDFNSIPGSAAHSLLVKGRVEPSQLVSGQCVCVCVEPHRKGSLANAELAGP